MTWQNIPCQWDNIHKKHVMIVKFFVVGIGLNGNKSMNITNVYSPKQNQYTSHGNWNPNFLHSPINNYKLHVWENHNWFGYNCDVLSQEFKDFRKI
jgi:hypothetical protein